MIISSERDLAQLKSLKDRRAIRNYLRFMRLWPIHGYDMLQRPFWQRYLSVSPEEARNWTQKPLNLTVVK